MMCVARQQLLSNNLFCLETVSWADICSFILLLLTNEDNNGCIIMKGHAIIGFNHGVQGLAEMPALEPGFPRLNTSG